MLNGRCEFKTMDNTPHYVDERWDMIIAFPPCTHLALSGAKHFQKKREDDRQRNGIEFFSKFLIADCEKIAIENPSNIISGGNYIRTWFPDLADQYHLPLKYTQRVQPWMFGDPYEKTTCLWLKNLPNLYPTYIVTPENRHITSGGKSLPSWYSNTAIRMDGDRQKVRSKTFPGIAEAMALQWTSGCETKREVG